MRQPGKGQFMRGFREVSGKRSCLVASRAWRLEPHCLQLPRTLLPEIGFPSSPTWKRMQCLHERLAVFFASARPRVHEK